MSEKPVANPVHNATGAGPELTVAEQNATLPQRVRTPQPRDDVRNRATPPVTQARHPAALRRPEVRPELATIEQVVKQHRALTPGGLRQWVKRADAGDATFALLRLAIVRIGRAVYLSVPHFESFLESHRCLPPSPSRNLTRKTITRRAEASR